MGLIFVTKLVMVFEWDAVSFCRVNVFAVLCLASSSNAFPWLIYDKRSLKHVLILGETLDMLALCKYGQKVIGIFRWAYCEDRMLTKKTSRHDVTCKELALNSPSVFLFYFILNGFNFPSFLLLSVSSIDNSFVL